MNYRLTRPYCSPELLSFIPFEGLVSHRTTLRVNLFSHLARYVDDLASLMLRGLGMRVPEAMRDRCWRREDHGEFVLSLYKEGLDSRY